MSGKYDYLFLHAAWERHLYIGRTRWLNECAEKEAETGPDGYRIYPDLEHLELAEERDQRQILAMWTKPELWKHLSPRYKRKLRKLEKTLPPARPYKKGAAWRAALEKRRDRTPPEFYEWAREVRARQRRIRASRPPAAIISEAFSDYYFDFVRREIKKRGASFSQDPGDPQDPEKQALANLWRVPRELPATSLVFWLYHLGYTLAIVPIPEATIGELEEESRLGTEAAEREAAEFYAKKAAEDAKKAAEKKEADRLQWEKDKAAWRERARIRKLINAEGRARREAEARAAAARDAAAKGDPEPPDPDQNS